MITSSSESSNSKPLHNCSMRKIFSFFSQNVANAFWLVSMVGSTKNKKIKIITVLKDLNINLFM